MQPSAVARSRLVDTGQTRVAPRLGGALAVLAAATGRSAARGVLLAMMLVVPASAAGFDHAHSAWTALLARHVAWNEDGTASAVDYAGFARDRASLEDYLTALAAVSEEDFAGWPAARRQAFLINAYNAHTVALILTRHPGIESIKALGSWFRSPWKRPVATLLGQRRSLDDIEHGLLRGAPDFAEPRIHFAVNCASIGCPALRHEAYVADRYEAQLEDQTRRFLADRSRNRIAIAEGVVAEVSPIFAWYADDFGGESGVGRFLARYGDVLEIDGAALDALREGRFSLRPGDYDWTLNDLARRP